MALLNYKFKLPIKVVLLLVMIVATFSCVQSSFSQEKPFNYEEWLQKNYSEKSKKLDLTWKTGVFLEYGLILDHMEMKFSAAREIEADNKAVVCGILDVVGYGKNKDGDKYRVFSRRTICHLFEGVELKGTVTLSSLPNKLLRGWDNGVPI